MRSALALLVTLLGMSYAEAQDFTAQRARVLAEVVKQVYSIELLESLGRTAAQRLGEMGYKNVEVKIGDGYAGWPERAPFDGIIVTAAAPKIPPALIAQLKPGGRM